MGKVWIFNLLLLQKAPQRYGLFLKLQNFLRKKLLPYLIFNNSLQQNGFTAPLSAILDVVLDVCIE